MNQNKAQFLNQIRKQTLNQEAVKKSYSIHRNTMDTTQDSLYQYTWLPESQSWMIGNDSKVAANAVLLGELQCPAEIIVPSYVQHDNKDYPVEVIGQYAFNNCAVKINYPTKTIIVSKQVKVIKFLGIGSEYYLHNFSFESRHC